MSSDALAAPSNPVAKGKQNQGPRDHFVHEDNDFIEDCLAAVLDHFQSFDARSEHPVRIGRQTEDVIVSTFQLLISILRRNPGAGKKSMDRKSLAENRIICDKLNRA